MRIGVAVGVLSAVCACQPDPSGPGVGAIHLEFVRYPSSGTAGEPMSTISVSVFDERDHVVADSTLVTLSAPNPFTGRDSAPTVRGVATFDGLIFTTAGVGLRFVASTASGAHQASGLFDVSPDALSTVAIARPLPTRPVSAGDRLGRPLLSPERGRHAVGVGRLLRPVVAPGGDLDRLGRRSRGRRASGRWHALGVREPGGHRQRLAHRDGRRVQQPPRWRELERTTHAGDQTRRLTVGRWQQ